MKILVQNPPRQFAVGQQSDIVISDMGEVHLQPNEQVSFVTPSGKRHDFACKEWGFYATPSVNGRLKREGFKTALVRNEKGFIYVMVVATECRNEFDDYCSREGQEIVQWLDELPSSGGER